MPILNSEMTLCISLSGRPSNLGTRFHNYLYDQLGLNFIYKAFSTTDLPGAIAGVRALGIRGCSVSMPFKEDVLALVDVVQDSAAAIESVNTIVNENGVLTASNTDYEAIAALITRFKLNPADSVLVRGAGGMAKAVVAAFSAAGFTQLSVLARNTTTGAALAAKYGYNYLSEDPAPGHQILVNVTPLGMEGADAHVQSFSDAHLAAASTVFDVVAFPALTPLIRAGQAQGKTVITGAEVIALQAAAQFEKYTGRKLNAEQVAQASEFSRRQPAE